MDFNIGDRPAQAASQRAADARTPRRVRLLAAAFPQWPARFLSQALRDRDPDVQRCVLDRLAAGHDARHLALAKLVLEGQSVAGVLPAPAFDRLARGTLDRGIEGVWVTARVLRTLASALTPRRAALGARLARQLAEHRSDPPVRRALLLWRVMPGRWVARLAGSPPGVAGDARRRPFRDRRPPAPRHPTEERRMIARFDEALCALQSATFGREIYGADHPQVATQVTRAATLLNGMLAERRSLTFMAFDDRVVFDDRRLPSGTSLASGLIARLRSRGVECVTFNAGLTEPELAAWLDNFDKDAPTDTVPANTAHILVGSIDDTGEGQPEDGVFNLDPEGTEGFDPQHPGDVAERIFGDRRRRRPRPGGDRRPDRRPEQQRGRRLGRPAAPGHAQAPRRVHLGAHHQRRHDGHRPGRTGGPARPTGCTRSPWGPSCTTWANATSPRRS